jgi:hypothetical protein
MEVPTDVFSAITDQVADQADQIARLTEQFGAMTEAIRLSYAFARRPVPEALHPQPRDRHGLHLVRSPEGGAA